MFTKQNINALRMERQFLDKKANEDEYISLYRDTQPGQNVYWHGFGEPPSISFRADFNDTEFNRSRQRERELIKGRFQGGNLGWIMKEDLELFAALSIKPLDKPSLIQSELYELIEREGPLNIQTMKEITGRLVKEITPALHRLQEAFLIYEDQYDGEWDRGWYRFSEMFPDVNLNKYKKAEALKIILQRFAYRNVFFNAEMAKSFYKLPGKDIKSVIDELNTEGIIKPFENGFLLASDFSILENNDYKIKNSIFVMHRNDFLVKSNETWLKEKYNKNGTDILFYILIDGDFAGAVLGKFKYGPYIIQDIIVDLNEDEYKNKKNKIFEAICMADPAGRESIRQYKEEF